MNHDPPVNMRNLRRLYRMLLALREAGRSDRFGMLHFIRTVHGKTPLFLAEIEPGERSPEPYACGTVACLAGWCALIGARTFQNRHKEIGEFAREWLGLDVVEAEALFFGDWTDNDLRDITLDQTIRHLERQWSALTVPPRTRKRKKAA